MGLDMFLNRKRYSHTNEKGNRVYSEEEVGYWRKANQIHNYIVEHFANGEDNCQLIGLDLKDLENLLDVCEKVRKSITLVDGKLVQSYTFNAQGEKEYHYIDGKVIKDTSICEELLPTCSGFFFGNTDYNEWYVQDIDYTIDLLKKLIKEEKELNKQGIYNDFIYEASW